MSKRPLPAEAQHVAALDCLGRSFVASMAHLSLQDQMTVAGSISLAVLDRMPKDKRFALAEELVASLHRYQEEELCPTQR